MTSRVRVPRRRHRILAVAATAALAGAPLLAGAPAGAGVAQSPDPVTFTGGCGLLGMGGQSTPDVAELSVPAGSELRFTNQLGRSATLWLDGEQAAGVRDGESVEVTFHDGPVTVSMRLDCLVGGSSGEVTVEVAAAEPGGSPGAAGPDASTGPADGGAVDGGPADDAPAEPGTAGAGDPESAPDGVAEPDRRGPDEGPAGDGERGVWPGVEAGMPADGPMSQPGADDDPGAGSPTGPAPEGSDSVADPATVTSSVPGEPAELSHAAGSESDEGVVGLLALIATVCVVGVSAGAVRVLISQRSNRTEWA